MKAKSKKLILFPLFISLLFYPLNTIAQEEQIHLETVEGIERYKHHADQDGYCVMVNDLIFQETSFAELTDSGNMEERLLAASEFLLRKEDTFEEIDRRQISVDFSSLNDYQYGAGYPVRYSYRDDTGVEVEITAYVYIIGEEALMETEEETLQTEEETEQQESEAVIMEETQTEIINIEEIIIVEETERETFATEPVTEAGTEINTEVKRKAAESESEVISEEAYSEQEAATERKMAEEESGIYMELLNSSMYIGTFSVGGSALIWFIGSIKLDLRVLKKHDDKLKKLLKAARKKKIKGGH